MTDKPWSGFNYYEGDYRSRVAVNADVKQQMSHLPALIAHESYPGHHTEHCRKEAGLVAGLGHAEQTIFLVNTPQCLMAEGLADLALHAAVDLQVAVAEPSVDKRDDRGRTLDRRGQHLPVGVASQRMSSMAATPDPAPSRTTRRDGS